MSESIPVPKKRISDFENLGFGLFVHWGLYSKLGRGEWVQHAEKIETSQYLELIRTFDASEFDAPRLVQLARESGMKYIALTTRHHEGFSLYDTRGLSQLDVLNSPENRDLIFEFVEACRAGGIEPFLYHTTLDWNDPRFESDWEGYLAYLRESVAILCTHYGKIGGFWFDGNWSKPYADWKEAELYAVIRKLQPDAIIVNNTGIDALGVAGHKEVDSVTFERGRPKPLVRSGTPRYVAAEMCHTMNFHWGVANHDFNYLSPAHVIEELCFARGAGANLLMNIGPGAKGGIPQYEGAVLAKVGEWINLHGGTDGFLYRGRPCDISGEGDDFVLQMANEYYFFIAGLTDTSNTQAYGSTARGPGTRTFSNVPEHISSAHWVDSGEPVSFEQGASGELKLHVPAYPYGTNTVIRIAKLQ